MVTEGNVRAIYAVLKLNIYNENGKVKVSVKEIKTKGSYLLHMVLSSGRPYQVTGSISQERASSLNIISAPGETQWSIPIVLELQKGYPVREAKAYGQITVHIVLELEELATGSKQTRVVSTSASIEDHWRVS
ncbi:MAG: hypothetical protein N3F67_02490 [Acidilobaceae archaeon]|nr:hypothetical protein [Acidilobaceae archaeon]